MMTAGPLNPSRSLEFQSLIAVALLSVLVTGCDRRPKDSTPARATFSQDGSLEIPVGFRQWSHVGTSVKFKGINVLDGSPIRTPEALDAYVEPGALADFQKTGKWPDGSQIVKEYSAVKIEPDSEGQESVPDMSMGKGLSETHYDGLAMMVKDSKRFADAPGNWAYFSFGHKAPPYNSTAKLCPVQQCASCHVTLASDSDFVVSRAHIGLAWKIAK